MEIGAFAIDKLYDFMCDYQIIWWKKKFCSCKRIGVPVGVPKGWEGGGPKSGPGGGRELINQQMPHLFFLFRCESVDF